MASGIISTLVGLFCTIISGTITFMLTKRKYNTEVESQQIQNMSTSFDVYKKMMEETVASLTKKVDILQKENASLRQQVGQLQIQMVNLVGTLNCPSRPSNIEPLSMKDM